MRWTDTCKPLLAGLLVWGPQIPSARAGGFTACEYPFIFENTAANIVPVEYQAAATELASSDEREELRKTARGLAWIFKLDSWHQPTFGSLGIVSHLFVAEPCDTDQVLSRLLQGGASGPMREGQILLLLTGRIFQAEDDIFLQSRLFAMRRSEVTFEPGRPFSDYMRLERMVSRQGAPEGEIFSATWPELMITFAPRHLTTEILTTIDNLFAEASRVYANPDLDTSSQPLVFDLDGPHAFSVEIVDDEWVHFVDPFGGSPDEGFIRIDPKASAFLHGYLPELDFMNGVLGALRLEQGKNSPQFYSAPPGTGEKSVTALKRFLERSAGESDAGARAVAHALTGILLASGPGDWSTARAHFLAAAGLSPASARYRNLLGLADVALCCASAEAGTIRDPTQWFADSLSLSPTSTEPLLNMRTALESMALAPASAAVPEGWPDPGEIKDRLRVIRQITDGLK